MGHVYASFGLLLRTLQITLDRNGKLQFAFNKWYRIAFALMLLFYLGALRHLFEPRMLNSEEVVYVYVMPLVLGFYVHYFIFAYKNTRLIAELVETVQVLDGELAKLHWRRPRKSGKLRRVLMLVNSIFFGYFLNSLYGVYCFIFQPDLQMYAVQTILLVYPVCLIMTMVAFCYVLGDRTRRLHEQIAKLSPSTQGKNLNFCSVKHLGLITSLFKMILEICFRLDRLNNFVMIPILAIIVMQSPALMVVVFKTIFFPNCQEPFLKVCLISAICILAISVSYSAVFGFDLLREDLNEVGRSVHKLYLKHNFKSAIRASVVTFSMNHIQVRPKFELGENPLFAISCSQFLSLVNAVIMFSILVMQLDST